MAEQTLAGHGEPGALQIDVECLAAAVTQSGRLPGNVRPARVAHGKQTGAKQRPTADPAVGWKGSSDQIVDG